MSLKSRLDKIERTRPSESHGRVILYDADGQEPAPPSGAKVVILIPKNGRDPAELSKRSATDPSPTDKKKP